jgi:hypothetical protein
VGGRRSLRVAGTAAAATALLLVALAAQAGTRFDPSALDRELRAEPGVLSVLVERDGSLIFDLVITSDVLRRALGHGVGTRDYANQAWFLASLATIGGALGAGLESDEAVREAAYTSGVGEDGAD